MDLEANDSKAGNPADGITIGVQDGVPIQSPIYDDITAITTIAARSGQTVVFGGLITSERTDTFRGVPYLSDIPVLGHLFRFDTKSDKRQELLFFLTPHIVMEDEDIEVAQPTRSGSDELVPGRRGPASRRPGVRGQPHRLLERRHPADLPECGSDGRRRDAVGGCGSGAVPRKANPSWSTVQRRSSDGETVHVCRRSNARKASHSFCRRANGRKASRSSCRPMSKRKASHSSRNRTNHCGAIEVRAIELQPAVGWQAPRLQDPFPASATTPAPPNNQVITAAAQETVSDQPPGPLANVPPAAIQTPYQAAPYPQRPYSEFPYVK